MHTFAKLKTSIIIHVHSTNAVSHEYTLQSIDHSNSTSSKIKLYKGETDYSQWLLAKPFGKLFCMQLVI